MVQKNIVVLYHKSCADGFGAAWAAYKHFGQEAEYIGVAYQTPPPSGLSDKEIYILDFGYSKEIIEELLRYNKRVTVIDHHITFEKSAALTKDYLFDVGHSGAVLAWKYFHPEKPLPKLFEYIEDYDLWLFKKEDTKAAMAYVRLCDYNFESWNALVKDFENTDLFLQHISDGKTALRYEEMLANDIAQRADPVTFEGVKTYAVNSSSLRDYVAEILYKKLPPMSIVWYEAGGYKIFSLRSDGSIDVEKMAAKYGGGGHKAAAGFKIKATEKLPFS